MSDDGRGMLRGRRPPPRWSFSCAAPIQADRTSSSQYPSNCHFPSVYLFMFIEGFLFNAATCAASQSPDQFSGGVRAAGKKGWEAGLGQAKTFYTGNKHQSYLFQADSCQTEIVK